MRLFTSDDHPGIKAALASVFPGVAWQRCQCHMQRNAQSYVSKIVMKKDVAEDLRSIFNAPTMADADQIIKTVVVKYQDSEPRVAAWIEENIHEGLAVLQFPASHRRRLRTSNAVERLNKEIKRRTRVAGLFTNEAALLRLVTALAMEVSEDWEAGRQYLTMEQARSSSRTKLQKKSCSILDRALLLAANPAQDGQKESTERKAVGRHPGRTSAIAVSPGRGPTDETVRASGFRLPVGPVETDGSTYFRSPYQPFSHFSLRVPGPSGVNTNECPIPGAMYPSQQDPSPMYRTTLLCVLSLTAALPASAQCPNNDTYGNTSLSTAYALSTGYNFIPDLAIVGIDQGDLTVPDDSQDIFTLTLAPGATMQVDADFNFNDSALYAQIYRASTFVLLAGTNPNDQAISFAYTNATGVPLPVILKVTSGAAFQGCGDYDLTVLVDACPGDDEFEPNDGCFTAAFFSGAASSNLIPGLQRLSSQDGNDDWYGLDIQPGETLDASILFAHAEADLDFQLTGPNGTCGAVIQTSQSTTDNEFVSWTNNTGSMATIGMRAYFYGSAAGNTCCNYELAWEITPAVPDDAFEDNDTACTATGIGAGYYPDLRVFDADSDFFVQFVPANEQVEFIIDFDNANGDLDLRLFDISAGCASGSQVASSTSVSDTESVIGVGGPGGTTYVLDVYYYPSDGGYNDYTLSVTRALSGEAGGTICYGESNSTGLSSYIFSTGSASIGNNDLRVVTGDMPNNAFGFFNTSQGYGFVANPGGSAGNLCIAGAPIGRYVGPGQIQNSGTTGGIDLAIDWTSMPQPNGAISANPGETWYFQLWYRDGSPSGPTSNFSDALRVRTRN